MSKAKSSNPIIIDSNDTIGAGSAEQDDDFLYDCFVQSPAYRSILDSSTNRSILYGRTGTGKTAIIKMLDKSQSQTISIDLSEVSLDHLVNSDAIQFLQDLEFDVNVIFQAFWRYIICVAYIRQKYKIDDKTKSQRFVDKILYTLKGKQGESKACRFLAEHRDKFWVDTDVILEEYTQSIDTEMKVAAGLALDVWKSDAGYAKKQSAAKKQQLQRRLRSIIKPELVGELSQLIKVLKSESEDGQRDIYVLIDGIDENWVDISIRYKLIRSLIETQKTFRSLRDLKLVISMRADIFERALTESRDPSMQRDKLQDYKTRISWSKPELFKLIDMRVEKLCKFKYTGRKVSFQDIFTRNVNDKKPFDFIAERTLLRPRDIINFTNLCLSEAAGKGEVSATAIKAAEGEYSRLFKRGIIDEWKSCNPSVEILLNNLPSLRRASGSFELFLNRFDFETTYLQILDLVDPTTHDPVYEVVSSKTFDLENTGCKILMAKHIIAEFYKFGAIGLKAHPDANHVYVFKGPAYLDIGEITQDVSWYIHRGLRSTLGLIGRRKV